MALTLQNFTLAKQNYQNNIPKTDAASLKMSEELFSYLAQMVGSPDLQVVPFDYLTGTDVVLADAPCKVYAILLKKNTTTAAYFKADDSASTVTNAAPTLMSQRQNQVQVAQKFFPNGLSLANGLTVCSDTTAGGSTGSNAGDGAAGVALIGRP